MSRKEQGMISKISPSYLMKSGLDVTSIFDGRKGAQFTEEKKIEYQAEINPLSPVDFNQYTKSL